MRYSYMVPYAFTTEHSSGTGREVLTLNNPIDDVSVVEEVEAFIRKRKGFPVVALAGFYLLNTTEEPTPVPEDSWELTVSRDDTTGYAISGLTHAQMRGLDLLLSANHSNNRTHPTYMHPEQRRQLDELLNTLLPVTGGLQDTNTTIMHAED